jgi:hypothetical protein
MPEILMIFLQLAFIDLFYVSLVVSLCLFFCLLCRRFFVLNYSYQLAITNWIVLVVTAGIVAIFLLVDFFSHEKGVDRMSLVPLMLGASPLFFSALASLFLFPKKQFVLA